MTHLITAPIPVTFSQEITLVEASWTSVDGAFTQTITPVIANMPRGFFNSQVECFFDILSGVKAVVSAIKWQTTDDGTIVFTTLEKPTSNIVLRAKFWRSLGEERASNINLLAIDREDFVTSDNIASLNMEGK